MAGKKAGKKVFDFEDYREFLRWAMGEKGLSGSGLARFANVTPSLVSSVLKGDRDLTPDQAVAAGEFLGLDDLETEFLLTLLELARAGNDRARGFRRRRMKSLRQEAWREIVMGADTRTLTVDEKYVYYSDWSYSAVRMLTAVPRFREPTAIANHLELPVAHVEGVLEFLVEIGFCGKEGAKYFATSASPDIKRSDPVTRKHLQNCRQITASRLHRNAPLRDDELIFSVGAAYSKENALKLKEKIRRRLEDILVESKQGKAEVVYYLNVDFVPL